MPDVYSPPQSDLLGFSSDGTQPPSGRGVWPLDVGATLSRAWELVQPNAVAAAVGFLALMAINFAVSLPLSLVQGFLQAAVASIQDENVQVAATILVVLLQIVSAIVGQFVGGFVSVGMAHGTYRLITTEHVSVGDFLPFQGELILRAGAAQILMLFAVLAGTCALVVPGIILSLGLVMWPFAMVTERLGPVDALKRSWELTDGYKIQIFVWMLAMGILNIVVSIPTCFLAMFVTLPVFWTGFGLMFEGLRDNKAQLS